MCNVQEGFECSRFSALAIEVPALFPTLFSYPSFLDHLVYFRRVIEDAHEGCKAAMLLPYIDAIDTHVLKVVDDDFFNN